MHNLVVGLIKIKDHLRPAEAEAEPELVNKQTFLLTDWQDFATSSLASKLLNLTAENLNFSYLH